MNDPPSEPEIAQRSYGPPPIDTWKEQIRTLMSDKILGTDAAHYQFAEPEKAWVQLFVFGDEFITRLRREPQRSFGWKVHFEVQSGTEESPIASNYLAIFESGYIDAVYERFENERLGCETWKRVAIGGRGARILLQAWLVERWILDHLAPKNQL